MYSGSANLKQKVQVNTKYVFPFLGFETCMIYYIAIKEQ